MDKIVGKCAFIVGMLSACFQAWAGISLQAVDMRGNSLQTVGVGKPFKIAMSIDQANTSSKLPDVPGINQFQILGSETMVQYINGSATTTYNYRVTAPKIGKFVLGPVRVVLNGARQVSNKITINVVAQQSQDAQHTVQSDRFFARLKTDKAQAVIGEKINCSLRFYCADNNVSLQGVDEPDTTNFTMMDKKAPISGTEYIKGKRYSYVEWEWNAQPKKDGTLTLPAYAINFLAPIDDDDDFLAPFSFFSRKRLEKQRLYSNTVSLAIDPMPPFNGAVHAMGNFKYLAARMNPLHAKVGEGLVFSMELEGEGDMNAVELPELCNMPDCFKWYDSKSSVTPSNQKDGYSRKTFEYIVQGLKAGEWEIPKQRFTFFNPKTRSYKTLESEPLFITIKPDTKKTAQTYGASTSPELTTAIDTQVEVRDILAPLDYQHGYRATQEWKIPWFLFFILVSIPIIVVIYSKRNFITGAAQGKAVALAQARKSLHAAQQKRAPKELYGIFVRFFAMHTNSDPKLISQATIDHIVRTPLTDDQVQRWDLFFSKISELAFFNNDAHKLDNNLWQEAERWLTLFEKTL